MHIDVKRQILSGSTLAAHYLLGHLLDVPNRGVQSEIWLIKFTVEVVAAHRRSVVARNHPVRIQHGNHFEDDSFAQLNSLVALACELL